MHCKCRAATYPFSEIKRLIFPDNLVPWFVNFADYKPLDYDSKSLTNKAWADPPIGPSFNPKWNELDNNINRKSHMGNYEIKDGRPLNPKGRTGLRGRGVLGRWGPNHAADPIVTRWKMDGNKQVLSSTNKPILQFCAIQRKDCGQWAIPGGMVDPGENISQTLKREFMEEALNSLECSEEEKKQNEEMLKAFFSKGTEIYKGYVDDPRNTDNAWIETVAVNFHDENSSLVGKFPLKAGDDAANVRWMDISGDLNLYACHLDFIKIVTVKLGANW
ncbi:ADP-ribose pyrophosphatase, mitochondrial [Sitophilus oryzae]|uniref:ADP-ribose pyrophosphatase, mitochondrial n=1 Tax=Sitophilus oryzae TaxID=7048 RepID=A0A6J2XK06_SITOR|nr:ADP-ribose pyrophosphatase, mitochondrial [Sitophilus oryzae]